MLQRKASAEDWNIAEKQAPTVFAEVAKFTRVCAYLERIDPDRSFDQIRAAPPLRRVPLIVLSADRPWGPQVPSMIAAGTLPANVPPDFGYVTDAAQKQAQERLAKLVPNAKHITNTNSGHEIHKEQPQLVIDSIREVVYAVRDPASWP